MISKESLFNKALYKNTLHRFKWGSLLYFIILFFSGPFLYITQSPADIALNYYSYTEFTYENSRILQDPVLSASIITAFGVSAVVALLVFRFVHSGGQGIFTHSLPVCRTANYISTLCAAFTLMAAPVILNGLIFILMSVCGYEKVLGTVPALIWMVANLFTLFVMFSVAAFSAFLTGNAFAAVAINVLLNGVPAVIFLAVSLIGEHFLFGYSDMTFSEPLLRLSPAYWIMENLFSGQKSATKLFTQPSAWLYILFAAVLYAVTLLVYKKRKIELCGDVAGFRVMKPIIKYTVTFFVCVFSFALFQGAEINSAVLFLAAALLSAVAYFACEMVLRKNVRVLGAYKGYFAFVLCCGVVIAFSAFTSVFGYETYVPEPRDVKKATAYLNYNYEVPYAASPKAIENAVLYHSRIIENIPVTEPELKDDDTILMFEYKLNNGKTVKRRYNASYDFAVEAVGKMFEDEGYRNTLSGMSQLNIENINNVTIDVRYGSFDYVLSLNSDAKELFYALQKDIDTMSYEDYVAYSELTFNVDINLTDKENRKQKIFKEKQNNYDNYWFYQGITPKFKNAVAFLKEKGYYDTVEDAVTDKMYISKEAIVCKENSYSLGVQEMKEDDLMLSVQSLEKLEKEDAKELFDLSQSNPLDYSRLPYGSYYYVFCIGSESSTYYSGTKVYAIDSEAVPDSIKKYLK